MTKDKQSQQNRLNQDYADFLVEEEAAKAQGIVLGTFIAWRHANDRDGIKIDESRKR